MKKIMYEKLVRDRIPEIIEKSGKKPEVSRISLGEMGRTLDEKLREEVGEFFESHSPEEIADILEVLRAEAELMRVPWDEVERIRARKREERGGFSRGIFLHFVEES